MFPEVEKFFPQNTSAVQNRKKFTGNHRCPGKPSENESDVFSQGEWNFADKLK